MAFSGPPNGRPPVPVWLSKKPGNCTAVPARVALLNRNRVGVFWSALLKESLLFTRLKLSFVLLSTDGVKECETFARKAFPYSSDPTLYCAYGLPKAAPEKSSSSVQFTRAYTCVLLLKT